MTQKFLRLGFTECSLLFLYWLNVYKNIYSNNFDNSKRNLIKWLYTTSGYYDKTQIGNYFDVIHEKDPEIYNAYMEKLINYIKDCDNYIFALHQFNDLQDREEYIIEFKKFINPKSMSSVNQKFVFDFMKNQKILIISPFSPLIKLQIENGNCKKIYPNTPDIQKILIYKFPYTFFNNGPDNNILETNEKNFNEIIKTVENDYDNVIISCGAYSCILAEKFTEINKNVLTVGGDLQSFFGILNGRTKEYFKKNNIEITNKDYWILEIDNEYKPEGYMQIENGCYW